MQVLKYFDPIIRELKFDLVDFDEECIYLINSNVDNYATLSWKEDGGEMEFFNLTQEEAFRVFVRCGEVEENIMKDGTHFSFYISGNTRVDHFTDDSTVCQELKDIPVFFETKIKDKTCQLRQLPDCEEQTYLHIGFWVNDLIPYSETENKEIEEFFSNLGNDSSDKIFTMTRFHLYFNVLISLIDKKLLSRNE